MTTGILVLAAGQARRFGADKRRVRLAAGDTLLVQSLATLRSSGLPLRVCLRSDDDPAVLGVPSAEALICPGAAEGMGRTLAEGVSQVPEDWQGLLVALADMPRLQASTVCAVAAALQPGGIVVPVCQGRRGHPVGFHRDGFAALMALRGDRGARELLARAGAACREVPVRDPGCLLDVDRPEDLVAVFSPAGADPG